MFQCTVSCSEYLRAFMSFTLARLVFIIILLADVTLFLRALHADAKDCAVLIFTGTAHFK